MAMAPTQMPGLTGGGAGPGPQISPQGGGQTMVGSNGNTATTQITQIVEALKQIIPQVVDDKGYVNMDRLITLWPQFSQVPFQTVMQLFQQNPEILNDLIVNYGLAGIIIQGRVVGADELAGIGGQGGA